METNEILDNETMIERKNPVTVFSVAGLIALIVAALILCAPFVRTPGSGHSRAAAVAETTVVESVTLK